MIIPFADLRASHEEVADEVAEGFARVLHDTAFVQGPDVAAFEQEYAAFSGVPYCIGAGNGTDAIEMALRAADLPAGGEVILPANTFVATAEAVVRAGLTPVLADVDPAHLLLDPISAEESITKRTVAIIPVHLYGQQAPMSAIHALADTHGITVIEDAAQSQGSAQENRPPVTLSATSFYPGKNLGAYGEAGAVLATNDTHARTLRLLTNHGSERKYIHETLGFNSRLDTLQAVVLRAKLRRLPEWNHRRQAAAARYESLLTGTEGLQLPAAAPGNTHVWHLYVIRVPNRDDVADTLREAGVQVQIHYPIPVHHQPAFTSLATRPFPVTETAATEILSLPMHPHLTPDQQERVAEVLIKALG